MNTFYLRFPDEATYLQACHDAGLWITEEPERPLLYSHTHTLDVIGTIRQGGEWDQDTGEVITEPTQVEGFHVNARFAGDALPEGWDAYVVEPEHPVRVFA